MWHGLCSHLLIKFIGKSTEQRSLGCHESSRTFDTSYLTSATWDAWMVWIDYNSFFLASFEEFNLLYFAQLFSFHVVLNTLETFHICYTDMRCLQKQPWRHSSFDSRAENNNRILVFGGENGAGWLSREQLHLNLVYLSTMLIWSTTDLWAKKERTFGKK